MCLHGDEDFASQGKGIEGEQAEAGWAIDEEEVKLLSEGAGLDFLRESMMTIGFFCEFDFGGSEVYFGWEDEEVGSCFVESVVGLDIVVDEDVVDGGVLWGGFDAEME